MPQVRWNTRVDRLDGRMSRSIAIKALRWCLSKMGVNHSRDNRPRWRVYSNPGNVNLGLYSPSRNLVTIHWNNCPTVGLLVRTCVHEWTHQLQDTSKYDHSLPHSENPLEQEAFRSEAIHGRACWSAIKDEVNSRRYQPVKQRARAAVKKGRWNNNPTK
jgi:hypothetical protein